MTGQAPATSCFKSRHPSGKSPTWCHVLEIIGATCQSRSGYPHGHHHLSMVPGAWLDNKLHEVLTGFMASEERQETHNLPGQCISNLACTGITWESR